MGELAGAVIMSQNKETVFLKRHGMQLNSNISTRLHYQHKSLMDLVDGLSDEQIRRQVVPGKWSIFENVVHLQTYQHTFIDRVKQILEGHNPTFGRYTAEADPLFHDNCTKTSREIFQDYIVTRKEMAVGILALPVTDHTKTAVHPVFGQMTLLQWLNFYLLHEAHHLFTIFKLGAELRKAG